MTENEIKQLEDLAHKIRIDVVRAAFAAGKNGSHLGGCLSMAEMMAVLYGRVLNFPTPDLEQRDRVVMSKGHGALTLYAALHQQGVLSDEDMATFEQNGSEYTAHAHRNIEKGFEYTGGSLGLGFTYAVGVAYACKLKGLNNRIYCFVGDGELNEGIIWEALMFASQKQLSNLTIVVDHNHLQIGGDTADIINMSPLDQKFISFGCDAKVVDGHDVSQLYDAYTTPSSEKPNVIIAETTKGKGLSLTENKYKWHFGVLTEARYQKALKELGVQDD